MRLYGYNLSNRATRFALRTKQIYICNFYPYTITKQPKYLRTVQNQTNDSLKFRFPPVEDLLMLIEERETIMKA